MSAIALEARGLVKSFGGVRAVDDVGFAIAEGSLSALIGPNGAGKSTLFNLLTRLYPPDAGSVQLFEEDLGALSSEVIAARGLVRTFQTARCFADMTVLENVLAGAHLRARGSAWQHAFRLGGAPAQERALREQGRALLEIAGLQRRADEPAASLPLGEQKLVEVVRALMSRPRVLLLDEPAAGLNESETGELAQLLCALGATGITLLVVEHNMSLVMGIADDVLVLDAGRLIARGTPAQIQANAEVIEAYVGRSVEEPAGAPR